MGVFFRLKQLLSKGMYNVEYLDRGKKFYSEFIGTELEIRQKLSREGKVVLSLKKSSTFSKRKRSIPKAEVAAILSAFSSMLSSGVSQSHSLNTIIFSLDKNSPMRSVLYTILNTINQGKELSTAVSEYIDVFGYTTVSMIKAGEHSGKLAESLMTASQYILTIQGIKDEMKKKLSYPVIVFLIGVFALFMNTTFIIPKLLDSEMFKLANANSKDDNPLLGVLQFLSYGIPAVIGIFIALSSTTMVFFKTHQEKIEGILLKIPMLKEFVFYRGFYITFFSMAKLIEVGVNYQTSLEIVKNSTKIIAIKKDIDSAIKYLRGGEHFSKGFQNITPIEKTILETAQNQEQICTNLMKVATRFYEQYINKVKALAPKVYAFTILFVGGIFILMLLGIMLPYSKILGGLK